MKFPIHFPALLLMGMAVSPVAPQPTMPRVEPFGLAGERVTALRFSPSPYKLYATTDGNGVYQHDPIRSDSLWLRLGLYGKKITALDIQVWGVGPAVFYTPVVGVAPDYEHGDSTLIYRLEDKQWIPADSGIARALSVRALASFASGGLEPPGLAFANTGNFVYRSPTRSRNWETVFSSTDLDGPFVSALAVNQNGMRNEVWIGGYTGFFWPWICKSEDRGLSWQYLSIDLNLGLENGCHSFAFAPIDPGIVYADMDGTVIQTIDGGKTWRRTGLRDTLLVEFSGLVLDPFAPKHLYASGRDSQTFWESIDAGMTWQKVVSIFPLAGITGIVADPNMPGVIYIATAGDGVWRYESGMVAVQDQHEEALLKDFVLEQNYPNPFLTEGRSAASAGNAGTTIRFEISSRLANQQARLTIYNLRGELVREVLDKKLPAGSHQVRWDGKNDNGLEVTSGIYFYRLQIDDPVHGGAGEFVATRKLILMK